MDVTLKFQKLQSTNVLSVPYVSIHNVLKFQKVVQQNFHPPHPLSLLYISPFESFDSKNLISCFECLVTIEVGFYLYCTDCPFDLHLRCSFLEHNAKHDLQSEHPLARYDQIYSDDVCCAACNILCNRDLFRCFHYNFNIHKKCLSFPLTVDYDDHVHPLTLTSSFKEDDGHYYSSLCEERRDPEFGIYLCKECQFVEHFECALSTVCSFVLCPTLNTHTSTFLKFLVQ